ncbi:MAG TPA: FecR domain-containing protein [Terracidiphilus sp.]|nr:FecR domain-containing protein [Terracidiphilus sp.]
MKDEELLHQAIESMRNAAPQAGELSASTTRIADRLGISVSAPADAIESCDDIRPLLNSYRDGSLPPARALLVEAHLRECGVCLRRLHSGSGAVDWSAPRIMKPRVKVRPQVWGWAFATAFAVLVTGFFLYRTYWQVPPGVRADVESIDGSASLITNSGDHLLSAGAQLREGDQLRTSVGSQAVLRLADGSTVEMNERSAVSIGARGRNMTIHLDRGDVIVKAAHRTSGHLYLQTADCRAAVTGTVFSVDAGIKGSRVGVLEGTVEVAHAGKETVLHAGDTIATSQNLEAAPVTQQIAWSPHREQYLELVAQLSTLQHRIEQIPMPEPRYSSDLLDRVPRDTLLYVSIPNLGDFVTQARGIFEDQLKQSPVLQQWWNNGKEDKTAQLDTLVNSVHDLSQYLGNEMVIVAMKDHAETGFAVVADVERSGLDSFLKQQFLTSAHGAMTVLDEQALRTVGSSHDHGGYALIRPHEVIFSNSIDTLRVMDAQLNASSSGFAGTDFGQQITSAYKRGAGIILAANLHEMLNGMPGHQHGTPKNEAFLENSGIGGVTYLIAEHRQVSGAPVNHLNLQFSGTRQKVASWLGSPAPVGSLDFVSPNAALAVAVLSKDPASIADDMMSMMSSERNGADEWNKAQSETQIDFRNDIAANLGGEFMVALDGPVLPTPSWKAVIEVRDSDRLEATLEQLVKVIDSHVQDKDGHQIVIDTAEAGSQTFHTVRDTGSGKEIAQYTFSNGYMIVAPTRALLMDALADRADGNSLSRSTGFRALLPKDENENYSAVAYQNLSPVISPLLSQMSGQSAYAIRELASDAHPTAICAWGKDAGIEVASTSNLFGFDFLTIGRLFAAERQDSAAGVEPVQQ